MQQVLWKILRRHNQQRTMILVIRSFRHCAHTCTNNSTKCFNVLYTMFQDATHCQRIIQHHTSSNNEWYDAKDVYAYFACFVFIGLT